MEGTRPWQPAVYLRPQRVPPGHCGTRSGGPGPPGTLARRDCVPVVAHAPHRPRKGATWAGVVAAVAAFAVHSGFDFVWHLPAIVLTVTLLVGLVLPAPDTAPAHCHLSPSKKRNPMRTKLRTRAAAAVVALLLGGLLALFATSGPAVAFFSGGLFLDVQVESPARLVARGAAVDVPLEVTCNATNNAFVQSPSPRRPGPALPRASAPPWLAAPDRASNSPSASKPVEARPSSRAPPSPPPWSTAATTSPAAEREIARSSTSNGDVHQRPSPSSVPPRSRPGRGGTHRRYVEASLSRTPETTRHRQAGVALQGTPT